MELPTMSFQGAFLPQVEQLEEGNFEMPTFVNIAFIEPLSKRILLTKVCLFS